MNNNPNVTRNVVPQQQINQTPTPIQHTAMSVGSNSSSNSLETFLYKSAYLEGVCSDITVKSFGKEYHLHKLILWRSGFFKALIESSSQMNYTDDDDNGGLVSDASYLNSYEINLEDVEFITQESFEYVISFLYLTSLDQHQLINGHLVNGGNKTSSSMLEFLFSVVATASYLSVPSELASYHTGLILKNINDFNIVKVCQFATYHDYGATVTEKILDSCRGWLCSYGWSSCDTEQGQDVSLWYDIPAEIIKDVVVSDMFFVKNEFERCCFVIRIIQSKEASLVKGSNVSINSLDEHELKEIETLKQILNTPGGINYVHMSASQLHHLETLKDKNNVSYIQPEILKNAFWDGFRLRRIVTSSAPVQKTLGITTECPYTEGPNQETRWIVPVNDETIYDTPSTLRSRFKENNRLHPSQNHKVSMYPPYRFSIQFSKDQLHGLPCDKRIYSQTVWYMGSHWNLYIQKIRTKKGTFQMGVYLHRASNGDDPAMVENLLRDTDQKDFGMRGIARDLSNMNISADEGDPDTTRRVPGAYESDSEDDTMKNTPQRSGAVTDEDAVLRYSDPRTEVNTYYKIHTPTNPSLTTASSSSSSSSSSSPTTQKKKKRAYQPFSITCFASTPDIFNKSQSWGWKSNSMCGFDNHGNVILADPKSSANAGGLRFMVCLGLI
ncbi:hypothetical protein WICPIJ_003081 [Wickerhamomyces pijperi]|uniref:BTB domain-containing protein n=1 Tax=Wickerhamomyces pijperi TaxID=599730 RepID=A0A9P8QAM5_WICPI|nr:hypothetical protein WICPIJ_003081 [Wickerhamomyces pijperi]